MATSEFADSVFKAWLGQGYGEGSFPALIDAGLQEVREVLAECLAAFPESAEGEQRAKVAQRVHDLMSRLTPKEK